MAKGRKTGGRSKGTPNRVTIATRERIESEADPIGFLIRVQRGEAFAADGDEPVYPSPDQRIHAAVTLARKTIPDAKDSPVSIDLPVIEKPADAVAAMAVVVGAIAEGTITPGEGQAIAGVIETYRRTVETEDIARRLEALEQAGSP